MTISDRKPWALAAFVVAACASPPPPVPTSPVATIPGHWKLTSRACEGHAIVVPGLDARLDREADGQTFTMEAPGCQTVFHSVDPFYAAGDVLLVTDPTNARCAPDPCAIAVPATVDGRPGRTTLECPPRHAVSYAVNLARDEVTLYTSDGDCTLRFTPAR